MSYELKSRKRSPSNQIYPPHRNQIYPPHPFTPSTSFNRLPTEIILLIFQQIKNFNEFSSFKQVNQNFYRISKFPQALNCLDLIPSYIKKTTDFAIQQLAPWEKIQLDFQVEKKLICQDCLPVLFKIKIKGELIAKLLVNNYLILATSLDKKSEGFVTIIDIKTKKERKFKAHNNEIQACECVTLSCPLLITISSIENFKIWDLNTIMNSNEDPNPLQEFPNDYLAHSNPNHLLKALTSYKQWLGMGYRDHTSIFNFEQHSKFRNPLNVNFKNAIQIQISETHLLLRSSEYVAIWEMEVIRNEFEKESTVDVQQAKFFIKENFYKLAEMYDDKVIFGYENGIVNKELLIIGEMYDINTGQLLKLLQQPVKTIILSKMDSIDFKRGCIFIDPLTMSHTNATHTDWLECNNWCVIHKVMVIGRHVLFAFNTFILIYKVDKTDLTYITLKNPEIISMPNYYFGGSDLISFDLNGKYLMTETNIFDMESHETTTVALYDLN